MGTVIAGGVVTLIVLSLLFSGTAVITLRRGMRLAPDWDIIRQLFRFGLPTGFQGVVMNLGGVFLLRFIGSLRASAAAQAAYAVGYVQLFSLITWTSVGLMSAAAAVAGQNLGANKPERTVAAVHGAARIALVVAALVGALFLLAPGPLLAVFGMDDPEVVAIAVQLLRYLSVSGLFVAVALTYTGGLQGTGDTKGPLYISLVSQVVVPLGMCALIQATRELQPGDIWLAIVLGHATRMTLSIVRFRQGKWRNIVVDIDGERR
jgi:Na+-driven multidrug efflux pump